MTNRVIARAVGVLAALALATAACGNSGSYKAGYDAGVAGGARSISRHDR
jgi:hypothetical protein